MNISVAEVVKLVDGTLIHGPADRVIHGFDALEDCGMGDLSFYGNPRYEDSFRKSKAGAILVRAEVEPPNAEVALIAVENPTAAFDIVVRKYGAPQLAFTPGVHPTAFVDEDVELDPAEVSVGPNAVILSGCKIGKGSWVGPNSTIAQGVSIGEGCRIFPQVSIREGSILGNRVVVHSGTVIGSDGYGYEFIEGKHQKILQAGIVEIEDDVEIGANVSIDRARFGSTLIGEGTKIDNLVQIGHNVKIGKHCIIISQTGISGSSKIGNYVTLAAKCGIAGHITLADRVIIAGMAGVISDVAEEGSFQFGYPSKDKREWAKQQMYQKKVPGLLKRIEELESRLRKLEKSDTAGE